MRRHVQRVCGGRGNLRVGAGGRQRQDRVIGIVERVDDEMRRARMFRIALEDVFGNRRRLHRVPHRLLARPGRAEQRQRIQDRYLVIGRLLLVQTFHRRRIGDVARVFVAGSEQHVDGFDEPALLARRRLRRARGSGRRQPLERAAGGCDILLRPERMVVAHRLTPVSEREAGISLLSLAESLAGRIELEVVKRLHADEKRGLRRSFRGRRKTDAPKLAGGGGLRAGRHGPGEDNRDEGDE